MRKILIALILFPIQLAISSGLDEMILWRYESPIIPKGQLSFAPNQICSKGPGILLLHSNPYSLSSLNWDYATVKYGWGYWGIIGGLKSYALSDLYNDYKASLGMAYEPIEVLAVSASCDYGKLKFGSDTNFSRFDLNLGLSYLRKNLAGVIAVNRINLKKPYNYSEKAEPMVMGSIDLGEGMIFSSGFRSQSSGEDRWFFTQNINIIKDIDLQLGYMNNPNILQWGLDLSWRSFRLGVGYMAISKLNDTLIMGISWRAD
jgi:hypothetical protein